jgi:acetolactate synthase-1/2/3 large subunit
VIVIVGTPFDFRMGYGKSLKAPTSCRSTCRYATVGKNRDIALGLVGDVGAILARRDASDVGPRRQRRAGRKVGRRAARREKSRSRSAPAEAEERRNPIHPYRLAYEIDEFLTENTIFIGDGGDVVTFAGNVVRPEGPGPLDGSGPLGTLGVGVSFAMAAKLASPNAKSCALFGDGSFAMTGFDMQTAIRFGCRTSRSSATTRT